MQKLPGIYRAFHGWEALVWEMAWLNCGQQIRSCVKVTNIL